MRQLVPIPVILGAVLNSSPVSVDWKGLEPYDVIGDLNKQYLNDFKEINSIAALAYIICCSEWLYYFLHDHFKPEEATNFEQFIIASWVWVCDLPRKLPPYYDLTVVEVSQNRPANIVAVEFAINSIWEGIMCIPDEETNIEACVVTQMCDYVLPSDCGFKQWREEILQRLRKKFVSGEQQSDLVKVSRRFFNTDINVDDVDHEADCISLLSDGNSKENPYLPLTKPDPD